MMRIVLNTILTLILLSCSQKQKESKNNKQLDLKDNIQNRTEDQAIVKIKAKSKRDQKPKKIDSLQHLLKMVSGFNEISEDYYTKYLNLEKPEYDLYFNVYGSLDNSYKTLENYYIIFFSISRGGVCSYDQVATLDKKGGLISMMQIGENCDQEDGIIYRESISYKIIDSTSIKITKSIYEPKDKRVIDNQGYILDSLDINTIEMKITESNNYIRIMPTGMIEEKNL